MEGRNEKKDKYHWSLMTFLCIFSVKLDNLNVTFFSSNVIVKLSLRTGLRTFS